MSKVNQVSASFSKEESLPLVSVIIPAYNAEKFIAATLEAVLRQTYKNIEVIVIDDGSKDRTANIVQEFALKDSRVILIKQPNMGVSASRNLAIKTSKGEYIAPVDADDIWYPEKLEKQVQCMLQSNSSVGLVYTWSVHIDEDGLLTGTYHARTHEGKVLATMFKEELIGNASVPLIRRSCLDTVGLYNTELRVLEDFDLYLRIAERYEFRVVPEFLMAYRQVIGSMSRKTLMMAQTYNSIVENIRLHHPEIPATVYNRHKADMYYWLAILSKQSGNHGDSLSFLTQSVLLEPRVFLFRPDFYKSLLLAILYLLSKPISSLFWTPRSWYEFKKKLRTNRRVGSLAELTARLNKG